MSFPQANPDEPFVRQNEARYTYAFDPDAARATLKELEGFRGLKAGYTVGPFWTGPTGLLVEMGEAIAGFWKKELDLRVEFDRQTYSTFRPTLISRTANGLFLRNCCSGRSILVDNETSQSGIRAPGGYNAGMELPIASETALAKVATTSNPDTMQAELERLTLAYTDFMWDTGMTAGVMITPVAATLQPE